MRRLVRGVVLVASMTALDGYAAGGLAADPLVTILQAVGDRSVERTLPGDEDVTWVPRVPPVSDPAEPAAALQDRKASVLRPLDALTPVHAVGSGK